MPWLDVWIVDRKVNLRLLKLYFCIFYSTLLSLGKPCHCHCHCHCSRKALSLSWLRLRQDGLQVVFNTYNIWRRKESDSWWYWKKRMAMMCKFCFCHCWWGGRHETDHGWCALDYYSVLCCREQDYTTRVRLNFRSAYIYFSICFRLGPKGLPHNGQIPWLMWDRKIPRHDQQPSHSSLVFWIWEFLLYSIRNYIHPYLEYIHPKTSCEFKSVHTNLLIGVFSCTFVFLFTDLSTLPYTLTAMWGHGVWLQMLPLMLLQIDASTTSNISQ